MFKSWSPLWNVVVFSSVWDEPDSVVKIFVTMLAMKDSDHVYRGTAYQLAKQSRKTEGEVLEALRVLSSPDRRRQEPQEHDGRRIKAVEDGWLLLNGEKYRDMVSAEMKRARDRRAQAKRREKLRGEAASKAQPPRQQGRQKDPIDHPTEEQRKTGLDTLRKAVEQSQEIGANDHAINASELPPHRP